MRGFTTVFLMISACVHGTGAVMCNDGCAVMEGNSSHHQLPKGFKECTNSSMRECGHGQVCVSLPVHSYSLEIKDGETLENNTVSFIYSTCSGSGEDTVDCGNIGDVVRDMCQEDHMHDEEEARKHIDEIEKNIEEMTSGLGERLKGLGDMFGFEMPEFGGFEKPEFEFEIPEMPKFEFEMPGFEIPEMPEILGFHRPRLEIFGKREAAAAEEHKEPAAAEHKEPAAAEHKEPAAAEHKEPAAAEHKEPAAAENKEPATAENKEPATAEEEQKEAPVEEPKEAAHSTVAAEKPKGSEKGSFLKKIGSLLKALSKQPKETGTEEQKEGSFKNLLKGLAEKLKAGSAEKHEEGSAEKPKESEEEVFQLPVEEFSEQNDVHEHSMSFGQCHVSGE